MSCLVFYGITPVAARKASRLIGAHELAMLGRCALALRREGLGRRQVADESKSSRTSR